MIDFRIYYADGSVHAGPEPEDVPQGFVVAIASNDPTRGAGDIGRYVLVEFDIYIYSDPVGGWHGCNKYADLMNHLSLGCGAGGVRAVLPGLWVESSAYHDILKRARTDIGLRRKSANRPKVENGNV